MRAFVTIQNKYTRTLVTLKTRLQCVNLSLTDTLRLLLICFSILFHMYMKRWNETVIKQFRRNSVLVLFQFYFSFILHVSAA